MAPELAGDVRDDDRHHVAARCGRNRNPEVPSFLRVLGAGGEAALKQVFGNVQDEAEVLGLFDSDKPTLPSVQSDPQPTDKVRLATVEDFNEYRVCSKGYLT